jgi:hypothetical protein
VTPRRWGAVAFVVAELMSLPVLFVAQPPTDPAHNEVFALASDSLGFRVGWGLQIYALAFVVLGVFAVYGAVRSHGALPGLVTTVLGLCFLLPGTGFVVLVNPAAGRVLHEGHAEGVVHLLDEVFNEPLWIPVFLGGLAMNVGLIVLGIAILRSGRLSLSRWTGWLLIAQGIVGIPAFLDVHVVQLYVGPPVQAACYLLLATSLWREDRERDAA